MSGRSTPLTPRGKPRGTSLDFASRVSPGSVLSRNPSSGPSGQRRNGHGSSPTTPRGHGHASERRCTLWVHDEFFSKDDVLVNLALFPDGFARIGDLAKLVAFKSDTTNRDAEHPLPAARRSGRTRSQDDDGEGDDQGYATPEPPVTRHDSVHPTADSDTTLDEGEDDYLEQHLRYVFVVKDLSNEQRSRQPKLQVLPPGHGAHIPCCSYSQSPRFQESNQGHALSCKLDASPPRSEPFLLKFLSDLGFIFKVDEALNAASHVELSFRDEYLARSDMWRLVVSELSNTAVYKGQKILFMGTIKAQVRHVYIRGEKVSSAYFNSDTKPIFRSESARYVLFIQMSKEMWEFDTDGSGEIIFNKVISGFLPELFRRWKEMNARHLVSVILFTRMIYEKDSVPSFASEKELNVPGHPAKHNKEEEKPFQDFYRVVVSEMGSGEWMSILHQLKKEFKTFRRDVSIRRASSSKERSKAASNDETMEESTVPETLVAGEPSPAIYGNVLEAIHLASTQYSADYIDRDLVRTGISIVVVTPGSGLFQVSYDMLKLTTDALVSNGIGIDLVCLSRMPLHSVPLFKFRSPLGSLDHRGAQTNLISESNTPRQRYPAFGSLSSNQSVQNSPSKYLTTGVSPNTAYDKLAASGGWSYAVPHWVDVSFWAGSSDPSLGQLDDHGAPKSIQRNAQKMTEGFVPRVKMYELQMMGIMENEMSNISIRYLHESLFFPHLREQSQFAKKAMAGPGAINKDAPNSTLLNKPNDRPISHTFTSVFLKIERDLPVSKHEREAHKWLDIHDDLTFRPMRDVRSAEREARIKNKKRNDVHVRNETPSILATSFADNGRSPGGLNAPVGTAYLDRKMRERQRSIDRTRRDTPVKNSWAPSLRPARLSRQFSSGLRRLGAAPPKAIASTELKTENATYRPEANDKSSPGNGSTSTAAESESSNPSKDPATPKEELKEKDGTAEGGQKNASPSSEKDALVKDQPSQPIAIKSAKVASLSIFDGVAKDRRLSEKVDAVQAASISRQNGPKIDLSSSAPNAPPTLSPTSALAPWLTLLNPSNPRKDNIYIDTQFGRWQHVFPRPPRTSSMKWKSLCSPAAVPLTTEAFPTAEQLASEYAENPYNISQNEEDELNEIPRVREDLMRELVALRLSQGFQLVVGAAVAEVLGQASLKMVNLFDSRYMAEDGAMVMMSMRNTIHRLQCVTGGEVEVQRYVRKPSTATSSLTTATSDSSRTYKPLIRTTLASEYRPRAVILGAPKEDYNWNYVDSFIAGYEENFTEHLRFWRARFVLIPVEQPSNSRRPLHTLNEDNEEEVRLEGIRKLTQMWQRYRYTLPEERRYQNPFRQRKDTNPLDIVYQTRDPSVVIAAELDNLPLVDNDATGRLSQLFPSTEPFHRGSINLSNLAQEIQGEKGIAMQDRRWHFRLHFNCFIGFEMTTWLLQNFRDVETREEAEELGNELMRDGLFQHVEKRHQFRDGNFFYQMGNEYRTARPESRRGWFSTKRSSVPSTPMSDSTKESAGRTDRSRSSSNTEDASTDSGAATPQGAGGKKLKVALSKVMRYDVDHRKKSHRPEIINLHYDRLHNPDNCYHIRIDWINVTAKLIEDAIVTWATTSEKFGLRLVEVPIGEASSITDIHPFRGPYLVQLAIPPPQRPPQTYFDVNSFSPQVQSDDYYYHKVLLKRFNFVLDIEAADNFPADVDVTYSWGAPDYRFSQYIHRSGILLAQITKEGDFLLLANRLYNNRTAANNDRFDKVTTATQAAAVAAAAETRDRRTSGYTSPFSSPLVRAAPDIISGGAGSPFTNMGNVSSYATPENIKSELEQFCADAATLERFYSETLSSKTEVTSPSPSPGPPRTPLMEASIPTLGLPPSVAARDQGTPSPISASASAPPS
ncbi:MAG: vacuolar membrane-associated protein iml1 [Sclerophora amabilis]|nr:MAG: vacuolar membrane-associated protein iml1 [Sclerophora amabilis]